jgi:hypothetical protein
MSGEFRLRFVFYPKPFCYRTPSRTVFPFIANTKAVGTSDPFSLLLFSLKYNAQRPEALPSPVYQFPVSFDSAAPQYRIQGAHLRHFKNLPSSLCHDNPTWTLVICLGVFHMETKEESGVQSRITSVNADELTINSEGYTISSHPAL